MTSLQSISLWEMEPFRLRHFFISSLVLFSLITKEEAGSGGLH